MFFQNLLLVVSLMSFLRDFHISCCDEDCADKPVFTPSRLAVKYGDPTSARCSICQHCQSDAFGLEVPLGVRTENGTTVTWTVDRLTEFAPAVLCYYNEDNTGEQCCTKLPVTVYKPPDIVSIQFDPQMFEGHQDTLYCDVSDVAPVENLTVTFYRGQTRLGQSQTQFNDTEKKPVSPSYTLTITPSKKDDGGQFWCEAKLELGPEGPQSPPVVRSGNITATVHYKPQLISPSPSEITVREGDPLQLNCSAVGNPSPSYTWTLPFTVPSPLNGSIFTINSVSSKDGGQYTCSVANNMGAVTVKFKVVVQNKPQLISTSPSEITVREGDPLQLNCSAVGNPSPSYTWTLPFTVPSHFKGSIFTINSVSSKDGGQYTCSVRNNMGAVTVKFKVVVQGLKSPSNRLQPTTTMIHWFILCFMTLCCALV